MSSASRLPASSPAILGAATLSLAVAAGCHGRGARHHVQVEASAPTPGSRLAESFDAAPAASPQRNAQSRVLHVPFTRVSLVPSGHFDVKVWARAVNTGTLLDEHERGAVPVSEARFLWGEGKLYLFFYAADLDLQVRATKHDGPVWNDDGVALEFPSPDQSDKKKFVIAVSPTGVLADAICPEDADDLGDARCDLRWESGVRVGTDYDGTPNVVGDFDEEWAVELALPLASIAVHPPFARAKIPFSLRRCERAYEGRRSCGLWGRERSPGMLVLEPRET